MPIVDHIQEKDVYVTKYVHRCFAAIKAKSKTL